MTKKVDGETKVCRKSITAFASFAFAILYEFVLPKTYAIWEIPFDTKEYVFVGLLSITTLVLGIREWGSVKKTSNEESNTVL
jgi:hypothetical protein